MIYTITKKNYVCLKMRNFCNVENIYKKIGQKIKKKLIKNFKVFHFDLNFGDF